MSRALQRTLARAQAQTRRYTDARLLPSSPAPSTSTSKLLSSAHPGTSPDLRIPRTANFAPSPAPQQQHSTDSRTQPSISDHEWNLRFGRAVDTLTTTLPHFFTAGLVTHPVSSPAIPDDGGIGTDLARDRIPAPAKGKQKASGDAGGDGADGDGDEELESIYAPRIRLSYTPPTALPAPLPRTLTVEGLPLYLASALFIRHTLNALYTDLTLTILSLSVLPASSSPLTSPHLPASAPPARDKALHVRFAVAGRSRVAGARAEWDVAAAYVFAPRDARVCAHVIASVHPAPHAQVWDLMRAALARLRGESGPEGGVEGGQVGGMGVCSASAGARGR
ncbi:hypothetical protein DENSPDRAFT_829287 [Dentipellis sp. KUC8613]|nr:hypothetical protein DENSPDRAFT_829287 [Dentipellis sp. KUC8613]